MKHQPVKRHPVLFEKDDLRSLCRAINSADPDHADRDGDDIGEEGGRR